MTDKDVGIQHQIWTKILQEDGHLPIVYTHAKKFLEFIDKLVAERQNYHICFPKCDGDEMNLTPKELALRDFGIKEEGPWLEGVDEFGL